MPKGSVEGPSSQPSQRNGWDLPGSGKRRKGRDRQRRSVEPVQSGKRLPAWFPRIRLRFLSRHRISTAPVDTQWQGRGSSAANIPPFNDSPFENFWEDLSGGSRFKNTVDHRWVKVRTEALTARPKEGTWHLKTPGREAKAEKLKRFFQKFIYRVTGQIYKAHFYKDNEVLAQREVLAANVYKEVLCNWSPDPKFQSDYQVEYSYDQPEQQFCVAAKHLELFKDGSKMLPNLDDTPEFDAYVPNHDPITNLVIRRFLLGDEDYLKLDNYMYREDVDQPGKARLYSIDFGMSFYNQFRLPEQCSVQQFVEKLMKPSRKHRMQYRNKPTLLSLVGSSDSLEVQLSVERALTMISMLDDSRLEKLVGHVYQPDVRRAMLKVLQFKVQQARAMVQGGSWPEEPGRTVIDALVGRGRTRRT